MFKARKSEDPRNIWSGHNTAFRFRRRGMEATDFQIGKIGGHRAEISFHDLQHLLRLSYCAEVQEQIML
jgi:hypothetical protein